ncbi:LysR substrate-binding domain-containing protein [Pseudomonas sp. LRF_L74]|uniref:LysR substrate-binding domain-containing protein n=1 Tax=Pseudomonas sp. LRF_L74 TaxID=3369422 RepID=UPI003F634397
MTTQEVERHIRGYRRLIPSLTALVEFEAVARHASFTVAAKELGVTQAAVSRQVRFLEETLAVKLFHRLHRSIRLTHEGETLYAVVAESMQKMASVFDTLATGTGTRELVLTTTASFSQFRVLPRLAALRQAQPNLKLRLTTQMFTADLRHHDIDLAVRYGNGAWSDGTSILLFGEEVFPICSPAWLESNGVPQTLDELAGAELIDSDMTSEGWINWGAWFRGIGAKPVPLNYALRCSLYSDTVQAARHGQGVALGWGRLLEDMLASGELVRLTDFSLSVRDSYYVVLPNGRTMTPMVEAVVDWLRGEPVPAAPMP